MRKGKKKANKQENQKAHEKADAHRSDKAEHALPLMLDRKQLLAHFHIDPHKLYALMKRDELPFPATEAHWPQEFLDYERGH